MQFGAFFMATFNGLQNWFSIYIYISNTENSTMQLLK